MSEVGTNLKRLRAEAGFSQAKLAEMAGISQQLVSQLEKGENVATNKLPEIAKSLGVQPKDIDPRYAVSDDDVLHDVGRVSEYLADLDGPDRDTVILVAERLWKAKRGSGQSE